MSRTRTLTLAFPCLAVALALAACSASGPPLTPAQRAARLDDVPQPAAHPPGIRSSFPPGDSSFDPLNCWNNGQETVCSRNGS